MSSYREIESHCEATFLRNGPFGHLYTSGKGTPVIFSSDEDYAFAMNLVCQSVLAAEDVGVMAFAIMSNHLHLLTCGNEASVCRLFAFFRKRLAGYVRARKMMDLPETFSMNFKPISNLRSLRNTIVYINRNGYVADSNHTPFSYPWGTGRYYFNYFPVVRSCRNVFTDERRRMFCGRAPELPDDYLIIDGYVAPRSFCDIQLGMAMFRNAHQYFQQLSKNVEAYNELAQDIDDNEFLTDSELSALVQKIVKSNYGSGSLREISKAQRLDIARSLRFDYRSSNGQICRVLNLSGYDVNALFPLSAKE